MSGTAAAVQAPLVANFYPLNLYQFYTDLLGALYNNYQIYGRVFRWRILTLSTVVLGADANQWLMVTQGKSMSAAKAWQLAIGELFRGGLLLRDGADHRQQRRLLMPAFRQDALNYYLQSSESLIERHVVNWPARCPDIYPRVKELTLEIAVQSFFGVQDPKQLKTFNRLITDVVAGSIAFNRLPYLGRVYHRAVEARRQLVSLLLPLIAERRQHPSEDMVGQLCQSVDDEGQRLSDEDIIDQLIFVMMAAHDTTASTLSSLFCDLALHPEWQERLREEALRVQSQPIAMQPEQLQLTQMTIRETLRRHAPLKLIPRVAMDDTEFGGFAIAKGTMVLAFPSFTHYMDEYWTRPKNFDPLRFSEERAEHKKHPYAYAPFGGGVHSCLGQFFAEKFLSVTLAKILLNWGWRIPDLNQMRMQQVPIQVPKGPLPVTLFKT